MKFSLAALKKKREKTGGKGKEGICVKVNKVCAYRNGESFRPSRERCYSLVAEDFTLKILGKPKGFAVKDPTKGTWLCWIPRSNHYPLFPFLIEFTKLKLKELKEASTALFLIDTPCGYALIKVSPRLPEVGKKVSVRIIPREEEKLFKDPQIQDVVDSFFLKPYFVFVNNERLKEILIQKVKTAQKPREVIESKLRTVEKSITVVEDLIPLIIREARKSPELVVPRELPVRAIIAAVLAVALAFGGYTYYQKKKEEEEALRARLAAQVNRPWTPSPAFKRTHLAYLFMPTSFDVLRLMKSLYPPEGYRTIYGAISEKSIKIEYETPYLVEGGRRVGDYFVLEKVLPRNPKPSWASLRGKPPSTIPTMKEVVKRYSDSIRNIKKDNIDGVRVLSAEVSVRKVLTPRKLAEELAKAAATPMDIEEIRFKLRSDGLYAFSLRAKVYGLEEGNER